MKQVKMSFGFSAVNAGQRNTATEPQVIATSTNGTFRLTPNVTKVLGIAHADYAMFINNIKEIDEAIATKNENLVAYCEENGLVLGTPEAAIAIHKEFDMWGVCKGIKEFDSKGNVKMVSERLTQADKVRMVSANFEGALEVALAEEGLDPEVREALTRDGVTKEEQTEILAQFVEAKEVVKYKGSKCANPAQLTGTGTALNFTDSNVWAQLKADLGDSADKVNRVFDVDVDNLQKVAINNGYEVVEVYAVILKGYTDEKPMARTKKADQE